MKKIVKPLMKILNPLLRFEYISKATEIIGFLTNGEPILDYKRKFFSTSTSAHESFRDSNRIIFSLTPLESKLLLFSTITMNQNFQISPDIKWRTDFRKYYAAYAKCSIAECPKDGSIRKSISTLKNKKALIQLQGDYCTYMVNPKYFSRNDLDRKGALKFLMEIDRLLNTQKRTHKKMPFDFDAGRLSKPSKFTLCPYVYKRRMEEERRKQFDIEMNRIN